jgi:hypothetical protein
MISEIEMSNRSIQLDHLDIIMGHGNIASLLGFLVKKKKKKNLFGQKTRILKTHKDLTSATY